MNRKSYLDHKQTTRELTPWEKYQQGAKKQKRHFSFIHGKSKPQSHSFPVRSTNDQLWFFAIFSILLASIVIFIYFASPFSRIQKVDVDGNDVISKSEILERLKINQGRSIFNVYGNDRKISDNLRHSYPQISQIKINVNHLNRVKLSLSEYSGAGFLQINRGYQPILSNGVVLNKVVDKGSSDLPVLDNFYNKAKLEEMLKEYKNLPTNIQEMISYVKFQPTKINPSRVHLYMKDKNQVYGTIDTFANKMKYYPSISKKNKQKQIINFELGAYSYPVVNEKAKKEAQAKEKAKLRKQKVKAKINKQKQNAKASHKSND